MQQLVPVTVPVRRLPSAEQRQRPAIDVADRVRIEGQEQNRTSAVGVVNQCKADIPTVFK